MKRNLKLVSLVTILIFCFTVLAGCGQQSTNAGGTEAASNTQTSSAAASTQAEAAATAQPLTTQTLPIADKPTTLTAWMARGQMVTPASGVKTLNDVLAYQELEKRTGIHIDWTHPAAGQEAESFNLLIASGEFPDIIYENPNLNVGYTGGLDKAVQDGVYIKLNDLIGQYAPYYNKVRNRNQDVLKQTMTDGGNLVAFYSVNTPIQGPWYGPAVRQDWLDDLGIKTPVTFEDWYNMLKAFKEKKNASAPLWLFATGADPFSNLISGYGVAGIGAGPSGSFYQVDGVVKYGPLETGYKEYITMLAKWYSEGLIDKDYYTRKDFPPPSSLADTGKSGAFCDIYTLMDLHKLISEDKKINVVAVPNPVKKAGDQLHLRQYNFEVGNSKAAITTACKDPVTAVRWMDYMYSDEGSILGCYGIEGKTYNMVDGKPVPTDLILKNPDGLSASDARNKYTMAMQPMQYLWERETVGISQNAKDAMNKIWVSNADGAYEMPAVSITGDEGTAFSKIMGDVDTYAQEMTTKFIIGAEPLSKYDDFVNKLKSMNAEDAVKIQQAALDRFNARK